jgi:hypothetical protein
MIPLEGFLDANPSSKIPMLEPEHGRVVFNNHFVCCWVDIHGKSEPDLSAWHQTFASATLCVPLSSTMTQGRLCQPDRVKRRAAITVRRNPFHPLSDVQ